ncbi:MAG TPA: hypothetical protein VFZ75_04320 [Actinomycetota bacterium]|nr:hypothetical protein [Actinomycetota bacterium]
MRETREAERADRGASATRSGSAIWLIACILIPSGLFLGRYWLDGTDVAPAGSDTPQHVWRSRVVADLGLEALPEFEGTAQALNTNADRPGLPLALAVLTSVTGTDVADLAYVLPAVAAAAIALAAAATAGTIAGVPWWGVGLAGVGVGASVQVAFAANGYLDQLLAGSLLLAAAAAALRAAGGGRGVVLGALLLLTSWLVHWEFALLFTALLFVLALGCLPASIRDRRAGRPIAETPSARVGAAALGGAAIGAAGLLWGTPGGPRAPIGLTRGAVERHLARQLPAYRWPATVVTALAGAAWLIGDRRDASRPRAAWLLVPWALLPAGAALVYAAGRTVPVQRSLSFALAIPLLGALGLVGALGWLRDRTRPVWAVVGAVVVVVVLVASVSIAWDAWRTREPWSEDRQLARFQALGAYLTAAGRPAIVVVDGAPGPEGADPHFGTVPVLRRLRALLPAGQALRTTVYLGDPDRLLADAPTSRPEVPGFDPIAGETWRSARQLLGADPTIVILRSQFGRVDDELREHPTWRSNGGVAVVDGPDPTSLGRSEPPARPARASLLGWWAASLALLTISGAGWSLRLADGAVAQRLALAPATGLAVLVPVCLVAEHLGVRVGGPAGIAVVLGVTFLGAVAAATRGPERARGRASSP